MISCAHEEQLRSEHTSKQALGGSNDATEPEGIRERRAQLLLALGRELSEVEQDTRELLRLLEMKRSRALLLRLVDRGEKR